MPTPDPVVQAGICLYDYVLNPAVRGEFNRVLAAAKAGPDDAEKILQEFFDRRQYATTPAAFKQVFSDYAKDPITLSPQATRVAIDFAANSVLRLDWYDAARRTAAGAKSSAAAPAGAAPDPLAPFSDVLQRNGYSDVTPVQATLAITQLLTSGIGAWTGIYAQTTIVDQQGNSKNGPTLTIDASADPAQVTLDKKHILGYAFDPNTNTLSWTKEGTRTFPNETAAKVAFSQHDGAPSFTGTLDNRDGSFSYRGAADRSGGSDHASAALATSAAWEPSPSDWIAIASSIVGTLIGVASLAATAYGVYVARKALSVAELSPSQANVVNEVDRLATRLANIETTLKIAPNDFARLISDPQVRTAIAQAIAVRQAPPARQGEYERQLQQTEADIQTKRNAVELEVTDSVYADLGIIEK